MNEREKSDFGIMGELKIDKYRQEQKLRTIRRSQIICLKCNMLFWSQDVVNLRMCESCRTRAKDY